MKLSLYFTSLHPCWGIIRNHRRMWHTHTRRTEIQEITQERFEIHSRVGVRGACSLTLSPRGGIIGYVGDRGELWVNALVRNDSLQSPLLIWDRWHMPFISVQYSPAWGRVDDFLATNASIHFIQNNHKWQFKFTIKDWNTLSLQSSLLFDSSQCTWTDHAWTFILNRLKHELLLCLAFVELSFKQYARWYLAVHCF